MGLHQQPAVQPAGHKPERHMNLPALRDAAALLLKQIQATVAPEQAAGTCKHATDTDTGAMFRLEDSWQEEGQGVIRMHTICACGRVRVCLAGLKLQNAACCAAVRKVGESDLLLAIRLCCLLLAWEVVWGIVSASLSASVPCRHGECKLVCAYNAVCQQRCQPGSGAACLRSRAVSPLLASEHIFWAVLCNSIIHKALPGTITKSWGPSWGLLITRTTNLNICNGRGCKGILCREGLGGVHNP